MVVQTPLAFRARGRARTATTTANPRTYHSTSSFSRPAMSVRGILFLRYNTNKTDVQSCALNSSQTPSTTRYSSATVSILLLYSKLSVSYLNALPLRNLGVFVATIFTSAFAFGIGFDSTIDSVWDKWNKGVCPSRKPSSCS